MINRTSIQDRLCQALKTTGQPNAYYARLRSAEFAFIIGELELAEKILTKLLGHATTVPSMPTPPQPFFPISLPPILAACQEDHSAYQARGGICGCRRVFYKGNDQVFYKSA